jgi:hypothetical protein
VNRHAIRKCGIGYAVVYHSILGVDTLYKGTKPECKTWLKEQIKLLKAARKAHQ